MAIQYYDFRYNFYELDLVPNIINDISIVAGDSEYAQIVLFRLLIPRGQYSLNPTLGSDLHLLKQAKSTGITQRQIENIVLDALEPEVLAGNLENIQVSTTRDHDTIKVKVTMDIVNGSTFDVDLTLNT